MNGEQTKAMIVDWQYEPIKGSLLHIDLKRIAMDKALRVSVPIVLQGVAEGVKTEGGILGAHFARGRNRVPPGRYSRATSMSTFRHLTFGKVLRVADLPHNQKIKFLTDENQPIAHVTAVKEEVAAYT